MLTEILAEVEQEEELKGTFAIPKINERERERERERESSQTRKYMYYFGFQMN